MKDIRIYVCCHKPSSVAEHKLLYPIQVGAALADKRMENCLYDDVGENISCKNRSYCELTAQYWAWKNSEADYIGFFHYRRYLYPDAKSRRPYVIRKSPDAAMCAGLEKLIERHDVIAPTPEDMHISVREHYISAPHHRKEDFELIESIIREREPDYIPAMEDYFTSTKLYFGNIYVMKRELFHAYCAWLFPLLEEFDRRAEWENRTAQELRVDGYLAERLFGVYITENASRLRILHLPRVHFESKIIKRNRQCALNAFLPPGSKRRATIKSIVSMVNNS